MQPRVVGRDVVKGNTEDDDDDDDDVTAVATASVNSFVATMSTPASVPTRHAFAIAFCAPATVRKNTIPLPLCAAVALQLLRLNS